MPKIKVLGSLSGMEPILNHHHTSVVIREGESTYFFDAGENCSRLGHLDGVNLLNTRAIFISHTHYDHIGGLAGIFWNMRKICNVKECPTDYETVKLYVPELEAWEGIKTMLSYTEGGFYSRLRFSIDANKPTEGLIYEDENVKVYAYPTNHLEPRDNGDCRAFSYRIEFADFSMVYSGDFKSLDDLLLPVGEGCDLLMSETGHHKVDDVCKFAAEHSVGEILFYHHGREIMTNRKAVQEALSLTGINTILAEDGLEIER